MVALAVEPCLIDPQDHEWAASNLYDVAGLPTPFPPLRLVARRLRFRLRPDPHLYTPSGGHYCDGVIHYRPGPDLRRVGGIFAHEISEGSLEREWLKTGRPYSHGDVWRRAIALAAPATSLWELSYRTRQPITADLLALWQPGVDLWLIEARLRQIQELRDVA